MQSVIQLGTVQVFFSHRTLYMNPQTHNYDDDCSKCKFELHLDTNDIRLSSLMVHQVQQAGPLLITITVFEKNIKNMCGEKNGEKNDILGTLSQKMKEEV